MSYFPCDIPFMSDEELEENGIEIHDDEEKARMVVNVPTKVVPVWFVEKWVKEKSADGSPLRFFIEQMMEDWNKEQRVTILHEKHFKEES